MEIKQGDKVRVSKDAPWLYVGGLDRIFAISDSVVTAIEDDNAAIKCYHGQAARILIIPCKYLVKVDAETKEAKYRKGDRIKFKNIYELQKVKDKSFRWMLVMFASKEATITAVEDNGFYRVDIDPSIGGINDDMIECKVEPIATKYKVGDWVMISGVLNPQLNGMIGWISRIDKDGNKVSFQDGRFAIVEDKYLTLITQPAEQTEAEEDTRIRQMEAELDEFRKAELDRVLHPEKPIFKVTIDNVAMNWQRYEANLAKEVVSKVANKYNDPKEAAEYAVSVVKAVVDGLKRK